MQRATLTIEEAARALGIGRNTAYQAASRGEIPIIRVGRRFLVPRAAFERFLDSGKLDLAPEAADDARLARTR